MNIKFGSRLDDLVIRNDCLVGIKISDSSNHSLTKSEEIEYDGVILGVGHSARDVYQMLLSHNVELIPKDFAVSFNHLPLIYLQ